MTPTGVGSGFFYGGTMGHANTHGYPEIDVDNIKEMMRDLILVQWEEKKDTLLRGKLIQAETGRRQHYTGIVLKTGPDVHPMIKVGDRLLFDQFSGFEKFFSEKHGRLAIIEQYKQGTGFAIIPMRTKIENGELDYDYAAA